MSNTVTNVSAGKPNASGAIYVSALTDTLPTDASTSIDTYTTFACLGYVSEDGLTNANSPESETIKAWGGDTVLTLQSSKEDTFSFTLIEVMNLDVLKFVYGDDNVSGSLSAGITITANSTQLEAKSLVIDMNLRDDAVKRIVIPNATVSEVGEITYSDSDAIGYACTVTTAPDSDGNTHYEYILRAS